MQIAIVARCANGVVVWVRTPLKTRTLSWVCTRDQFSLASPSSPVEAEPFLAQLAQHSVQLSGALQQIVQLEV